MSTDPERLAASLPQPLSGPPADWQPSLSGDMALCISASGEWLHEGLPIHRDRLRRLFAGILRREADGHYYLVTPVEKWRITVDDAPFQAVLLDVKGEGRQRRLLFTTDLGDHIEAGPAHPLQVDYGTDGEPRPYLLIRDGLRAKLSRAVFAQLAELAEVGRFADREGYGVWGGGEFFYLGPTDKV